jgi:hypothetical protein
MKIKIQVWFWLTNYISYIFNILSCLTIEWYCIDNCCRKPDYKQRHQYIRVGDKKRLEFKL